MIHHCVHLAALDKPIVLATSQSENAAAAAAAALT